MSIVETHPEIAAQWHPSKNSDLKPEDFTCGSGKKVWWKCPKAEDHEWEAAISDRVRGGGCSCCAGKRVVQSNCLTTTHPDIAAQWHSTKNGDLRPEDYTAGNAKRVWWKCPVAEDHEWESSINNRVRGSGCPCCNGRKAVQSNCLSTTHPEIAAQWHPTKNSNLKPENFTCGNGKKIWWKCFVGHEWRTTIANRSYGNNCPYCSGRVATSINNLVITHPEIVAQWHSTKNGDLKPENFKFGSAKKVWWKCSVVKDHEWKATIKNRVIHENGCPYCKESRGEKAIDCFLRKNGIKFKREHRFKTCKRRLPLPFDFIVKYKRIHLIEYQGEQHYVPIKIFGGITKFCLLKKNDWIKERWCKKHNIPLLQIPYWDFSRIPELLNNFLEINI